MKFKKFYSKIWDDPRFYRLSTVQAFIYIFISTHKNLNPIGFLMSTPKVIAAEMDKSDIDENIVKEAFKAFEEAALIDFDEKNRIIIVLDYVKTQIPDNDNVMKLWKKTFEQFISISEKSRNYLQLVINHLKNYRKNLSVSILDFFSIEKEKDKNDFKFSENTVFSKQKEAPNVFKNIVDHNNFIDEVGRKFYTSPDVPPYGSFSTKNYIYEAPITTDTIS